MKWSDKFKKCFGLAPWKRIEYRRFAAILILKEKAEHASSVFNVHVPEFVYAVWVALKDPTLPVREHARDASQPCLGVIEKHETHWRVQWYFECVKLHKLD